MNKPIVQELDEFLPHQFYMLGRLLRYDLKQKLSDRQQQLTPEQFFIIHRLFFKDAQSQKELADKVLQDHSNVTRLLDKLEKHGFIWREEDENDRRNFIIRLSPKGREAFEQIIPLIRKWRRELMAGIGKEEINITQKTLNQIKKKMRAYTRNVHPLQCE